MSEHWPVCCSERVNASVLVVFKLHRHCEVSGYELNFDQTPKCVIVTKLLQLRIWLC